MRTLNSKKTVSYIIAAVVAICLSSHGAFGVTPQLTFESSRGRVVIIKANGIGGSGVMKQPTLRVRTSQGYSDIETSKIVYIYRKRVRWVSGQSIMTGELLEQDLSIKLHNGPGWKLHARDILFLTAVPPSAPPGSIVKINVFVVGGTVSKRAWAKSGRLACTSVVVLDEYSVDRIFTISNPEYHSVMEKLPTSFDFGFDVMPERQINKEFLPVISYCLVPEAKRGIHAPTLSNMSKRSYTDTDAWKYHWKGLSIDEAVVSGATFGPSGFSAGTKRRLKRVFNAIISDFEGSSEIYLFVAPYEPSEKPGSHAIESSPWYRERVHFYKTVSNVLRLPVEFK